MVRDLFSIQVFSVFLLDSIINLFTAEALCARGVNVKNLFKAKQSKAMQTMTRVMNVGAIFIKCIAPFVYVFSPCILNVFQSDSRFRFLFLFWNNRGNWMSWVRRLSICANASVWKKKRKSFQTRNTCEGERKIDSKQMDCVWINGVVCTLRSIQNSLTSSNGKMLRFFFLKKKFKWFKVIFTHKCAQSYNRR